MASTSTSQAALSSRLPVGVHTPGGGRNESPLTDSAPTLGYRFNHMMIRIQDPEPTLNFYVNLMGMRTVFAINTGPMTVYYLGYPQTPEHRADPAAFAQHVAQHSVLTQTLGLLELCHYHGSENEAHGYISSGNIPPHLGFNHLGFTVPSVPETVERLRSAGVKVVKDYGQGPVEGIPTTTWEREKGIATDSLGDGFLNVVRQVAFVEDPNGYLVELVPQQLSVP
ncbi:lactoylglutathione lyase [Rhinocladiella mackenziei CBS 650.93]|uniref:Lactoylglutathione lyase n=1 Tax=Rhinocladiella mackenziei CBS 650.93 TaxID=1442369 RepID=A0A0D2HDS9_9EURO|nr:lactoylglutathione lyase [Rhinocladiella mackenziei CBS 650.93]KIX08713.1 lactoylglutathione lyase [Rhinocladiella mackenziei CBS 650.93]